MSLILTESAQYGDSDNTLLLKIAWKFWGDLVAPPASLQSPKFGDSSNELLLKIAQYLALL